MRGGMLIGAVLGVNEFEAAGAGQASISKLYAQNRRSASPTSGRWRRQTSNPIGISETQSLAAGQDPFPPVELSGRGRHQRPFLPALVPA